MKVFTEVHAGERETEFLRTVSIASTECLMICYKMQMFFLEFCSMWKTDLWKIHEFHIKLYLIYGVLFNGNYCIRGLKLSHVKHWEHMWTTKIMVLSKMMSNPCGFSGKCCPKKHTKIFENEKSRVCTNKSCMLLGCECSSPKIIKLNKIKLRMEFLFFLWRKWGHKNRKQVVQ